MQQENTTAPPSVQAPDLFRLHRLHRGSLAAYSVARVLRESHEFGDDNPLTDRDQHGLMLAPWRYRSATPKTSRHKTKPLQFVARR